MTSFDYQLARNCPNCTLPREFCEFTAKAQKCLGSAEDEGIPQEVNQRQPTAKKEGKGLVSVKKADRARNKSVTLIQGLQHRIPKQQMTLKEIARKLALKFACGASVSINAANGEEEIVVQGDVTESVVPYLCSIFAENLQLESFSK